METMNLARNLERLLEIGVSLTSRHNLEELLSSIVSEARDLVGSDGASLYIVEDGVLRFRITRSRWLEEKLGKEEVARRFSASPMPVSEKSIAGYVGATGQEVCLDDVYRLDETSPYRHNPDFDRRSGYTTRSLLAVPMKAPDGRILGVLQLINRLNPDGTTGVFEHDEVHLARSLSSQAAVALHNAQLTEALKKAHLGTIYRLAVAVEYRDQDSSNHIQRVSRYSEELAQGLGMLRKERELILFASPMHDVGKLGIADAILKKPGKLTPEERTTMEEHTLIGARILEGGDSEVLIKGREVALTHHERFDGKGYPRGLAGEAIPLSGRLVALADVYDALSSRRVYKPPLPEEEVFRILREGRGTNFDPGVVDVFFARIDNLRAIRASFPDTETAAPAPAMDKPDIGPKT